MHVFVLWVSLNLDKLHSSKARNYIENHSNSFKHTFLDIFFQFEGQYKDFLPHLKGNIRKKVNIFDSDTSLFVNSCHKYLN